MELKHITEKLIRRLGDANDQTIARIANYEMLYLLPPRITTVNMAVKKVDHLITAVYNANKCGGKLYERTNNW
ncbi:MAG: hypothetical protein KTM48_08355 [Wolbachia endosymbiont of Pissodes strobi]|nr:hypothetical protein [Wolbachia endosymbiont of Pissodes strobi]